MCKTRIGETGTNQHQIKPVFNFAEKTLPAHFQVSASTV